DRAHRCAGARRLDDGRGEAHGSRAALDVDYDTRLRPGPSPALTRPVDVPRAVHAEVRVQHDATDRDEQVLASCLDGVDGRAASGSFDARRAAAAYLEACHATACERGPQVARDAMDRVALGHAIEGTPGDSVKPQTHVVCMTLHRTSSRRVTRCGGSSGRRRTR